MTPVVEVTEIGVPFIRNAGVRSVEETNQGSNPKRNATPNCEVLFQCQPKRSVSCSSEASQYVVFAERRKGPVALKVTTVGAFGACGIFVNVKLCKRVPGRLSELLL